MKRGKPTDGAPAAADDDQTDFICGICGTGVDNSSDFLQVQCNKCGQCSLHFECAVEFLEARANEKSNSTAVSKYKVKARKRPIELFELRVPCPNGIYKLTDDRGRMPGSNRARGKHTLTGACSGFTIGGELIKPAKEPPAPLPLVLPAHALKEKKDKGKAAASGGGKAAGGPAPNRNPAATATTNGTRRPAPGVPAPGSGASIRMLGSGHLPWVPVGGKKPGGHSVPGAAPPPDRLRFPQGVPRPAEITLCAHALEDGDCYVYNCAFAHSQEELRRREKEWAARQEGKKREAARRQAAAQAAALAHFEEEQEALAQVASIESLYGTAHQPQGAWGAPAPAPGAPLPNPDVGPGLTITARSLSLLRTFKRALCLNSLLEMGFPCDRAGAAADAAAGDVERAAQMLMDGLPCSTALPVDVSREVEELASVAVAVGVDAEAVEAALVLTGGNIEAAVEAMQSPAGASGSAFGGSAATPEDMTSRAPSEPDTPSVSLRGPAAAQWATDASSSLSAPSPGTQSPRSAAAAAAAAAGPFVTAASATPGVLSLADFSDGPGPEAGLELLLGVPAVPAVQAEAAATASAGWQASGFVFDSHAGATTAASFGMGQSAQRFGSPLPTADPQFPGAAGEGGFSDGYAAGLAAAAAMLSQAPGGGQPGYGADAHASAGYGAAPPANWASSAAPAYAQPAEQPAEQQEDIDDLLLMLGVS